MIEVTITEDHVGPDGKFNGPDGKCYGVGQTVSLTPTEYNLCFGGAPAVNGPKDPVWSDFCSINGAWPKQKANGYLIPPGECAKITISELDPECPPNRLYVRDCGSCFLVGFDEKPVMETNETLSAPMIHYNTIWVGEDPETCERPECIFLMNPSTTDSIYLTVQPLP